MTARARWEIVCWGEEGSDVRAGGDDGGEVRSCSITTHTCEALCNNSTVCCIGSS